MVCQFYLSFQRTSFWLSCFLRYACIAMNFPLRTAFTVSHRFFFVLFSFSFVSMQILIFFLISSVICWLFSIVLFSLHLFEFTKASFMAQDVIYPGEGFMCA